MKSLFPFLLAFLLVISLGACTVDEPVDEPFSDTENFSFVFGNWITDDGNYELRVNDVGQVWYFYGGELLFRGYFEKTELSADDPMYEYFYRYDLYNDADTFMMSYYFDSSEILLIEENLEGEIIDRYEYQGEFVLE